MTGTDSISIVMRLVERMLDAEARVKELEEEIGNMTRDASEDRDAIKRYKIALDIERANVKVPPNPALESVLAKLRLGFFKNWHHMSDDVILALGVTVGDLRRWIESENAKQ